MTTDTTTGRAARLTVETVRIPSAALGAPSRLVPLRARGDVHEVGDDADIDPELRDRIAYGRVASLAPYLPLDDYDRVLAPRDHTVAVLENPHLRAEILVHAGGRLRSLIDKRSGRELLHRNAVFQPANLGLRDAWFSGGVEWNIGTIGHSPFTAAALHAVVVHRDDGAAALRMYEYERLRGVHFVIDIVLGPQDRCLLVTVTIANRTDHEVPMYWWSNMAVTQTADARVLVPAHEVWRFGYEGTAVKQRMPHGAAEVGIDRSRPADQAESLDYFFDVPAQPNPWIAAVDGAGRGVLQLSTERLRGRKLFVWGDAPGSAHWQSWLSHGTGEYFEIQAGLAQTQLEHLRMPPQTTWAFTEAYGALDVDARRAQGSDWDDAVAAVTESAAYEHAVSCVAREQRRDRAHELPGEAVSTGSGWGALEEIRRARAGEPPLDPAGVLFPATQLTAEQDYWIALLDGAETARASDPFVSYQRDTCWLRPLERRDDPAAALHRAVILAAHGELEGAVRLADAASDALDDGIGHRIAANLAAQAGRVEQALRHYAAALDLLPENLQLLAEAAEAMIEHGRSDRFLQLAEAALPRDRSGRIALLYGRALLAVGRAEEARELLDAPIEVAGVLEGANDLGDLWNDVTIALRGIDVGTLGRERARAIAEKSDPVPAHYEFRMFSPHAEP